MAQLNENKKAKKLAIVSIICILIQFVFFLLPGEFSGLLFYILWIPPVFFVIWLFMTLFQWVLNKF